MKLRSVHLISGDVPLLMQEAVDEVRAAAKKAGFSERECYSVVRGFDWERLLQSLNSPSLFAEKRLVELRIPSPKLGNAGGQMLLAMLDHLPDDVLLLIVMGKVDGSTKRTKWFKAIDQVGAIVQIWPVHATQLPQWIRQRMQRAGLQTTPEGIRLLAERIEGNLLAGAQEIEKLRLRCGSGSLSAEQIAEAVTDSARFDVFALVDHAFAGKGRQALRVLEGLRGEGVEPVLVLWALTRELRTIIKLRREVDRGGSAMQVMTQYHVWERRKPIVSGALQRHAVRTWEAMLLEAGGIDRTIKGAGFGGVWDALAQLCLHVSDTKALTN